MSTRTIITAVLAVALFVTPASADWDPGDGYKMHYPQLPDLSPEGLDVLAGLTVQPFPAPVIKFLADDFLCTETGPITDVHIWGSWLRDLMPVPHAIPDAHGTFVLALYDDIPAVPGGLHSMPGELLWHKTFKPGQYQVREYANAPEEFFDPNINQILGPDTLVWQYNFLIDEAEAWVQDKDNIYWLAVANIDANNDGVLNTADLSNVFNDRFRFGWKSSRDHWNDDAVYVDTFYDPAGLPPELTPPPAPGIFWEELRHPFTGESLDLSFVITPEPTTLTLLSLGSLAMLRRR